MTNNQTRQPRTENNNTQNNNVRTEGIVEVQDLLMIKRMAFKIVISLVVASIISMIQPLCMSANHSKSTLTAIEIIAYIGIWSPIIYSFMLANKINALAKMLVLSILFGKRIKSIDQQEN